MRATVESPVAGSYFRNFLVLPNIFAKLEQEIGAPPKKP